jgi:hypothetical protein
MRFTIRELLIFTIAAAMTASWTYERYFNGTDPVKMRKLTTSEDQLSHNWVKAELRSSDLEAEIKHIEQLIAKKGMRLVRSCGKPYKIEQNNRHGLAN